MHRHFVDVANEVEDGPKEQPEDDGHECLDREGSFSVDPSDARGPKPKEPECHKGNEAQEYEAGPS